MTQGFGPPLLSFAPLANLGQTFTDAFEMADRVLYSGVSSITDLIVKEGLINLDFADVRSIMQGMGPAIMGTGTSAGVDRARAAAEAALANPMFSGTSIAGARSILISISGGPDMTLYDVDEAASRVREEVGDEADVIVGAAFDDGLDGAFRIAVFATGLQRSGAAAEPMRISA